MCISGDLNVPGENTLVISWILSLCQVFFIWKIMNLSHNYLSKWYSHLAHSLKIFVSYSSCYRCWMQLPWPPACSSPGWFSWKPMSYHVVIARPGLPNPSLQPFTVCKSLVTLPLSPLPRAAGNRLNFCNLFCVIPLILLLVPFAFVVFVSTSTNFFFFVQKMTTEAVFRWGRSSLTHRCVERNLERS